MPHLRFRGFAESVLEDLTPGLVAELAPVLGCPPDWITVEVEASRYLTRPPLPFVEVVWFERGPHVRAGVVGVLLAACARAGVSAPTVRFQPVAPADYYEDGRPSGA